MCFAIHRIATVYNKKISVFIMRCISLSRRRGNDGAKFVEIPMEGGSRILFYSWWCNNYFWPRGGIWKKADVLLPSHILSVVGKTLKVLFGLKFENKYPSNNGQTNKKTRGN